MFDSSMNLNDNCDKMVAYIEYVSVLGSLMYAIYFIRLDIAFAICYLSRYIIKTNTNH